MSGYGASHIEVMVWFSSLEKAREFYAKDFAPRAKGDTVTGYEASANAFGDGEVGYVVTLKFWHTCKNKANHVRDAERFVAKTCGCAHGSSSKIRECEHHRTVNVALLDRQEISPALSRRSFYGRKPKPFEQDVDRVMKITGVIEFTGEVRVA